MVLREEVVKWLTGLPRIDGGGPMMERLLRCLEEEDDDDELDESYCHPQ